MKTALKSFEATVDADGQVHLLQPLKLLRPAKAVVTMTFIQGHEFCAIFAKSRPSNIPGILTSVTSTLM